MGTTKALIVGVSEYFIDGADNLFFCKNDIIAISEKIDTYETSIQPFEDCCTIFVAKHPVTKPNLKIIERSEQHLNEKIDELMQTAIETTETITVCEE